MTYHLPIRDNPVVAHGRRYDTIAASFLVRRGPHGGPLLGVSHLLHTRRSSHLRAFLYKIGNVEGEVLDRLIDLNVVLPGCCRPDPVMIFLQPAEQTHPRLGVGPTPVRAHALLPQIPQGLLPVKIPAASGGAFRAGGHYADMARSASTCPSKEAICYVGGICPPNPLTRMPFLPTASSGASWHDFVKNRHPLPYPLNVGLYGYDGIRVVHTGCIRAGRRP